MALPLPFKGIVVFFGDGVSGGGDCGDTEDGSWKGSTALGVGSCSESEPSSSSPCGPGCNAASTSVLAFPFLFGARSRTCSRLLTRTCQWLRCWDAIRESGRRNKKRTATLTMVSGVDGGRPGNLQRPPVNPIRTPTNRSVLFRGINRKWRGDCFGTERDIPWWAALHFPYYVQNAVSQCKTILSVSVEIRGITLLLTILLA